MQIQITSPQVSGSSYVVREEFETERTMGELWWLWLIFGLAWIAASLVVLQFDKASITTVGIITGIMFAVAAAQQFVLMAIADRLRWVWAIFGGLFAVSAVICFIHPEDTFAAFADILGFLFLCVGAWWMIRAFVLKAASSLWWLDLAAGIAMIALAFWTSGQFFIEKAYTLLVFAGIWALMHGITDIVWAFRLRSARNDL
jgi:uncharacterized membrane protein HdeD (DUF308 family)